MDDNYFPPKDDQLNVQALRAAWGYSTDYVRDLCSLLRSGREIHPTVREALAEALEQTDDNAGVRLKMSGHGQKLARDYEVRLKWMAIGRFVADHMGPDAAHGSKVKALKTAAKLFNASFGQCEKADAYFRRVREWVASVRIPGTSYGSRSEAELEQRYHGFNVRGVLPPPNANISERAKY